MSDVPQYGRGELIADAAVHIAGLVAAFVACIVLAMTVPWSVGPGPVIALGLYAAGLLTMLGCSVRSGPAPQAGRR